MKKLDSARIYFQMSFAHGFISSMIFTVSQIYRVLTVGLDPLELVLVGTTLEASVFLFEIPTGVVADVYSRRLSTITGMFLIGFGFIIEGAFPIFAAVLLAQFVWGLGWTFISGARAAWIADEVGAKNVGPVYLRGSQYYLAGNLIGIPAGIALGQIALNIPILVGGGLFLLLGLYLVLFMPENGFKTTPKEERETWQAMKDTVRAGFQHIRTSRVLVLFFIIVAFIGLYSEGYDRLSEAHFLQNFTFPSAANLSIVAWFGIMRAGSILFAIVATEIAKRKIDTSVNVNVVKALQGIFGLVVLGLLTFALTRNFFVALMATLLVDAMRATSDPLISAWINRHIPSKVRATVLSTTGQVDALGQVVGGPIVGAIGTWRSLRTALTASALLLVPVVPLFGRTLKEKDEGLIL